jgi:malonyl-CoA O-methyltransferase
MLSAPINLPLVRQLFERPNNSFGTDFLRREIASRMKEKLSLVNIAAARVLDAGCGGGADMLELRSRFAGAHLLGIDGSLPSLMEGVSAHNKGETGLKSFLQKILPLQNTSAKGFDFVCGDFSQVSLAARSIDVVWSNLALHWHPQPDKVFAEWLRLLRIHGLLMFSCFGPDTLIELREAFSAVDAYPHSLPFVDMHDLGDMLVNAGFATPVMDMEKISLSYADTDKLLADVKALGGNPLETRRRGLLGRNAYAKLKQAFEKQRGADGRIQLTFEVVYGHAFRPEPSKLTTGESIIRLDFPRKS